MHTPFTFSLTSRMTTMPRIIHRAAVSVAALATLLAAPARTTEAQIVVQPTNNAPLYGFGADPFVPTVGQTFIAQNAFLTSFSFFLSADANTVAADQLPFTAYIAAWDGTSAVGPLLFTGPLWLGPSGVGQRYQASSNGIALTPGASYIAFLSVSGLGAPLDAMAAIELSDSNAAGGELVFAMNGDDLSALTQGGAWASAGVQAQFEARFSATTVPEPATFVLFAAGLAIVGIAARRRMA